MQGKVVIIVGATGGIGSVLARKLATIGVRKCLAPKLLRMQFCLL